MACKVCGNDLVLSVPLIEYILEQQAEHDREFQDEIEAMMMIAGSHEPLHMEDAPFSICIDIDDGTLCFIGYCSRCSKAAIAGITPLELDALIDEMRAERRGNHEPP